MNSLIISFCDSGEKAGLQKTVSVGVEGAFKQLFVSLDKMASDGFLLPFCYRIELEGEGP